MKAHLEAVVKTVGGTSGDIIRWRSQAMQAMKLMPAPDLCHLSQVEELLTVPQDALQACHQFGIQIIEN